METEDSERITSEIRDWRHNIHLPFVLDIFLHVDSKEGVKKTLIEQWKLNYESFNSTESSEVEIPLLYKKIVVMIRSLYALTRFTPAYKIFRSCKRRLLPNAYTSYELNTFTVNTFSHSTLSDIPKEFHFEALQTSFGRLTLSSTFVEEHSFEKIAPQPEKLINSNVFISDYAPNRDQRFPTSPPQETAAINIGSRRTSLGPRESFSESFGVGSPINLGIVHTPPQSKPVGIPSKGPPYSQSSFSQSPPMPSFSPSQLGTFNTTPETAPKAFLATSPPFSAALPTPRDSAGQTIHLRGTSFQDPPFPSASGPLEAPFQVSPSASLPEEIPSALRGETWGLGSGRDSDVGRLVEQCKSAPPLVLFTEDDKISTQSVVRVVFPSPQGDLFDTLANLNMDSQ